MKTTLNLDDDLLVRAKRRAAERGTTLTRVVEDALRASLLERPSQSEPSAESTASTRSCRRIATSGVSRR